MKNLLVLLAAIAVLSSCEKEILTEIDPNNPPPNWADPMIGEVFFAFDIDGDWTVDSIVNRSYEFSTGELNQTTDELPNCQFSFDSNSTYEFSEDGQITNGTYVYDNSSIQVEHLLNFQQAVLVDVTDNTFIFCYNTGDNAIAANRLYHLSR